MLARVSTMAAPVFARLVTHEGMEPTPSHWQSSSQKWQQLCLSTLYVRPCQSFWSMVRT